MSQIHLTRRMIDIIYSVLICYGIILILITYEIMLDYVRMRLRLEHKIVRDLSA